MRKLSLVNLAAKVGICSVIAFSAFTIGTTATDKTYAATADTISLINTSKEYIGVPYKFGSKPGVTSSFDCSSFTQYVFGTMDVSLPRTSAAQAKVGTKVSKGYLSMGDLVFFKTTSASVGHVGIYAGNNKFIHSSSSKGVTITKMNSSYWSKRYVTARRVLS